MFFFCLPPGLALSHFILYQHASANLQHSSIAAKFNAVEVYLQFHHVETVLQQRHTHWTASSNLNRLQSVINAAAPLTVGAQHHNHITPLLADLHWLQMHRHIQYKLRVLVFQCMHGSAQRYLPDAVYPVTREEPRHRLHSASSVYLLVATT